jgi:RNA polymerase sigma-70 factor (ECF subfamily)
VYAELQKHTDSPVVALNNAAAVAMAHGMQRGLALLDELSHVPAMQGYHLFFAARADLRRRAGDHREAMRDYEQALRLVGNDPERRYLERRLAELRASAAD